MRQHSWITMYIFSVTLVLGLLTFFVGERSAEAVPSFARKYKTSCATCHTIYPVLNPFGEAFRRNGYRFPSHEGSRDSDATKAEMLPLGQEEYEKTFPNSIWPDQIPQDVPLSVMVNGQTTLNIPGSEAQQNAGNTYTHSGIVGELHIFGAGAFNDSLTFFSQLTVNDAGVDVETGYLLWNDVLGPAHLVNFWVGRLMSPSLTSFGLHSSYFADTFMPSTSIAALYNPTGAFTLGQGHTDGLEMNGVAAHRLSYALGWVASSTVPGLKTPNAQDVYAHLGAKIGGMSFDGEGDSGMFSQDAKHPWAETSITFDAFAYRGLIRMDNGVSSATPVVPSGQDDVLVAVGGSMRAMLDSLVLTGGAQVETHSRPYQGTAGTPAAPAVPADPTTTPPSPATPATAAVNGTPLTATARGTTGYGELAYVVFPWLIPGVRAEFTQLTINNAESVHILRVVPGVSLLLRANIKLVFTGSFEQAQGVPPAGSWSSAGASVLPNTDQTSKLKAETVNALLAWAF